MLQTYLCEYLIVVLRLCCKVVSFTGKSSASQFLSSIGSSFDADFDSIEKELNQWGYLIQQKSQQLAAKSILDTETKAAVRSLALSKLFSSENKKTRSNAFRYQFLHNLSAGQTQYNIAWRRQRRKGTCKWIHESAAYDGWKAMRTSSVLYVTGKLGSGKTVAMANIVAHMNTERPCAFFFCTFKEPETLQAINILRSIAFHILDGMIPGDSLWDSVMETYGGKLPQFSSQEQIIDQILQFMPENQRYVVILDGLEDCSDENIEEVLLGLRRLMQERIILLCYSARSESRFQRLACEKLGTAFSLSLDERGHEEEIQRFIKDEISRRNTSRQLPQELVDLIENQLTIGSQGM